MDNINEFKDIPWFEWIYKINKSSVIISLKYWKIRILKQSKDNYWYLHIGLNLKKRHLCKVHRLMLLTFIWKSDKQVNHKNWIKDDNRLENLEYCTNAENQKHRFDVLGHKWSAYWKYWKENPSSKSVKQFSLTNTLIWLYDSCVIASQKTWVHNWNIWKCCKGERKTAWWFIWRFSKII